MQKYKKPEVNEVMLGIIPYVSSLTIPVVRKLFEKQYKKDDEGDLIPVQQEIEYTEFTKIYTNRERRIIINNLSDKAKSLYLWLIYEIESGKDYIWINKIRYMEELSIKSIDTFKNALIELIRYSLLSLTVIKDVYWINT